MKSKLEEYKKGNWGEKYNEKCSNLTYFGGAESNVMITYYEKYKALLPDSYNKSEAEKIYKEYKNKISNFNLPVIAFTFLSSLFIITTI